MTQQQEIDFNNPKYKCRFFEKSIPNEGELCYVKVISVNEMGAKVTLDEYNDIEGMIPMSELSRKKFKQTRITRPGKEEIVTVLKASPDGYIDLSLKRISSDDKKEFLINFQKNKESHLIMKTVAVKCDKNLEDLYKQFGWPLANEYGLLHNAFKKALTSENIFDQYNLEPDVKSKLLELIKFHMKVRPYKLRAEIDVFCHDFEGVDAVKKALIAGKGVYDKIVIKLTSSPTYVMLLEHINKNEGIAILNESIEVIKSVIKQDNGVLEIKKQPEAILDDIRNIDDEEDYDDDDYDDEGEDDEN